MLKQRVITAVFLALILAGVLFAQQHWVFAAFMALVITIATWELARLSGFFGVKALLATIPVFFVCTLILINNVYYAKSSYWIVNVTLFWVPCWLLLAIYMLHIGVPIWKKIPAWLRFIVGCITLVMAWLAIIYIHANLGVTYLLSVFALIWVADSAAYFFGKLFGKRKLAVNISPGKSWEGVLGGILAGEILAFGIASALPQYSNFYADVQNRYGWFVLAIIIASLIGMSVAGDLLESLAKRSMGVKDSSNLLPGHGGVLDRIDAVLPVFPIVLLIVSFL